MHLHVLAAWQNGVRVTLRNVSNCLLWKAGCYNSNMADNGTAAKFTPHKACRQGKVNSTKKEYRVTVVLRSLRTLGDLVDLIYIEDARTGDDPFLAGLRDECEHGGVEGVYHGRYAKQLGLLGLATRKISPDKDRPLFRTTGPKKDDRFYPRQVLLRVTDQDRKDRDAESRKRLLNTVAKARSK